MCADMYCPDGEYLARLRPERLDVSNTYAASGPRIFFLMWTFARNAVLGITGLYLVHVAHLASFLADLHFVHVARLLVFSLLAYLSYALLVWPHSPR